MPRNGAAQTGLKTTALQRHNIRRSRDRRLQTQRNCCALKASRRSQTRAAFGNRLTTGRRRRRTSTESGLRIAERARRVILGFREKDGREKKEKNMVIFSHTMGFRLSPCCTLFLKRINTTKIDTTHLRTTRQNVVCTDCTQLQSEHAACV